MILVRDSQQPVVANGFSLFVLLTFDYANQSTLNYTARKCRRVHEQQHIDWVAVFRHG